MHLPRITLFAFASLWTGVPAALPSDTPVRPAVQAGELLSAARGVSPEMCSLAASAIMNGDWRRRPPYPAVAPRTGPSAREELREGIAAADLAQLLASLSDPDPCTREVAVQLLAIPESEAVFTGLRSVLRSGDTAARSAAAYALGLSGEESGAEALLAVLGDAQAAVRGNAAWALGVIDAEGTTGPLWRLV